VGEVVQQAVAINDVTLLRCQRPRRRPNWRNRRGQHPVSSSLLPVPRAQTTRQKVRRRRSRSRNPPKGSVSIGRGTSEQVLTVEVSPWPSGMAVVSNSHKAQTGALVDRRMAQNVHLATDAPLLEILMAIGVSQTTRIRDQNNRSRPRAVSVSSKAEADFSPVIGFEAR
jgi:hypothetical protein